MAVDGLIQTDGQLPETSGRFFARVFAIAGVLMPLRVVPLHVPPAFVTNKLSSAIMLPMHAKPQRSRAILTVALVFALLGSLVISPLAQGQGERACDMLASTNQSGPVVSCHACCAGTMPCCALSKRDAPPFRPEPLSSGQGHSHQHFLAAPILTFLPLFRCLPPNGRFLRLPERGKFAFSRLPRAAVSCIWLI